MRYKPLRLILCVALGICGAGLSLSPALAQGEALKQAPSAAAQDQNAVQDKALPKTKILLLETDHSAEEAKESLQGQSHGRGDGGHGEPSAGFGGMGPSHGGGPSPHR
ncbi:MAG: hypothetical protein KKF77_14560 [Proteobacteria bacterium]|nr:hypothetical protein [Pseudomonadota bacterium]